MSLPTLRSAGISLWLLAAALAIDEVNAGEPPKVQTQSTAVKVPAAGSQYQYVAETFDTVRQAGPVTAAGITWLCRDRSCTVSGPWPVPGIAACQALAAEVGALRSYGHPGRSLTSAELEQCNRGQRPLAPRPSSLTAPLPQVPAGVDGTASASPQPEPPTMPLPGVIPGKASTPAPAAGSAAPAPSSGGAGTGRESGSGAWPGEPGTPTPAPGSRGPGDDPDAIRDAVQRLRDEMAHCRPDDRPRIRLATSLRPEDTLVTDRVTMTWSVTRSDGGPWASRVFLGRADDAVAAYSEVGNSGARSFDGADLPPNRAIEWVVYTRCGEAQAYLGRMASPRISAIPSVVNCDRRVPAATAEHPCPAVTIQGSGFGPGSMPLRRVQLVAGDRVEDLPVLSWTDREITLRTPTNFPGGSYTVVVSRGFSPGRSETARTSTVVLVRWREILAKRILESVLQSILAGSEMVIDTMGERHCELMWSARALYPPYGRPLTPAELRTQIAYCRATPDPVACVQVTGCSIYEEGGSYLSLAIPPARPRRSTLTIPVRSVNVPLLGIGRYFVDDLRTLPRGMRTSFERGSGARLDIALAFESAGQELRGFGDSAGSDDDLWPDGDMNNAVLVMPTNLTVSDGTLTVVADAEGVQFSADIALGGGCAGPVDVCDVLGGYREAIRAGVASTVPGQFNSRDTQTELEGALRSQLCLQGIGAIGAVESDNNDLFLYPSDELGCSSRP